MRTAIVIGATGVTGFPLVQALLEQPDYLKVVVFTRRDLGIVHDRMDQRIVDFDQIDQWADYVRGDDLFSALGTTLKQAGSKQAQYKVDFTYQAEVIKAAAANGTSRLFLVSSPSASARSLLFYSRIKGELEDFALTQAFDSHVIFRPSLIRGERSDNRIGEHFANKIYDLLPQGLGFTQRYRPIQGAELAQAMINCALHETKPGTTIYELDQIFELLDD